MAAQAVRVSASQRWNFIWERAEKRHPRSYAKELDMKARIKHGSIAWLISRYVAEMARPGMRSIGRTSLGRFKLLQTWEIGQKDARSLKKSDVIAHCQFRRLTVTPATVQHDVTCLAVVLKYAGAAWDDCEDISAAAIDTAKPFLAKNGLIGKSTPRKRIATDEESAALWAYFLERDAKPGVKTKMCPVLAFAGLSTRRRGEICRIRRGDIDWERGTYMVRDMKNPNGSKGNHKTFPLFPELAEIISRQPVLDPNNPDECVFPYNGNSVGALYCQAKNVLGIKGLRFHDQRRAAITMWLKTLPPHKVRQISGHETTVILERVYAAPKAEDLLAEVAKQRAVAA